MVYIIDKISLENRSTVEIGEFDNLENAKECMEIIKWHELNAEEKTTNETTIYILGSIDYKGNYQTIDHFQIKETL